MDALLLDPAFADPAVVALHILGKLLFALCKLQFDPSRRVGVAALKGKGQRDEADQMLLKVEHERIAIFERIFLHLCRYRSPVQNRLKRFRRVQKLRITNHSLQNLRQFFYRL